VQTLQGMQGEPQGPLDKGWGKVKGACEDGVQGSKKAAAKTGGAIKGAWQKLSQ